MSLTPAQQRARQNFLDRVMTPEQKAKQKLVEDSFNIPSEQRITQPTSPARSSGGGSSRSTPTPPPQTYSSDLLQQSFTSEQARATAESQFRQQQQRQSQQAQAQQQQRDIVVSTARGSSGAIGQRGRVQVGGDIFIGSSTVPGTGGMTADQYRREVERRAIQEEPTIDRKRIRKYDFTISEAPEQIIETKTQPVKVDLSFDKFFSSPTVSEYNKPTSQDFYGQSYLRSFGQVGKNIGTNIKIFFTGKEHSYVNVLEPLRYSGTLKADKIAEQSVTYLKPRYGTIMTDPVTGKDLGAFEIITTETKTFGQIQSERESKRQEALANIQDLSPDLFQIKAKEIYQRYPDVPNLYSRTGEQIKDTGPLAVDVAITTGLTIGGSPLASAGYLTFIATQKASKGVATDIYKFDSGTYLDVAKQGPETRQAGLYLLSAVPSFVTAPTRIAKEIDVLRLKEGVASKSQTIGKFYDINEEKWIRTITRQQTPYYQSRTIVDAQLISKGKDGFALAQGAGTQRVKFLPFSEQIGDKGWKFVQTDFVTVGRGQVKPIIFKDVVLPEKFSATIGEGYVTIKDTRVSKDFAFGGITKDVGPGLYSKGGRVTAQRIYGEVSGPIKITDSLIEVPLRTTAKIPTKDTSFIFKKAPVVEDTFGLTVKKVGGKSSKEFFQTLYTPQVDVGSFGSRASSVVTKTTTETLKPSQITMPSYPLTMKRTTSIYAGTGQYERSQEVTSFSQISSTQPKIEQTSFTNITPSVGMSTLTLQQPKIEQISRTSTRQRSILDQKPLQDLTPAQTQDTRQVLKLRQQQKQQQKIIQSPRINITPTFQTPPPVIKGGGFGFSFLKGKQPKQPRTGIFQVLGRRFGKFKVVGMGRTEKEAFGIGKDWAGKSLGATFKVPKARARKLPGFKTKVTKEGKVLYIEPAKRRLKRGSGEIPEIQMFRRVKGGKKK